MTRRYGIEQLEQVVTKLIMNKSFDIISKVRGTTTTSSTCTRLLTSTTRRLYKQTHQQQQQQQTLKQTSVRSQRTTNLVCCCGRNTQQQQYQQQQKLSSRRSLTTDSTISSSSSTATSTGSATGTTATATTTTDGVIISRRVWYQIQQQHKKQQQQTTLNSSNKALSEVNGTNTTAAASSKPQPDTTTSWPRSIQLIGYFGGFVVVPYLLVWFIVANTTLRDEYFFPTLQALSNKVGTTTSSTTKQQQDDDDDDSDNTTETVVTKEDSTIIELIRKHYGEIDSTGTSYVDTVDDNTLLQYILPGELSQRERYQQKLISYNLTNTTIEQVQFYLNQLFFNNNNNNNNSNNKSTRAGIDSSTTTTALILHNVPASVLASTHGIIQWIKSSLQQSTTNNDDNDIERKHQIIQYYEQYPDAPLSIDFPLVATTTTVKKEQQDRNGTIQENEKYDNTFIKKMNTYSYWHYQDPDHVLVRADAKKSVSSSSSAVAVSSSSNQNKHHHNSTSTTTSTLTDYIDEHKLELLIQQYEYDIRQLQIELNDGAQSRSVDDILDEIEHKKHQLRAAQWNRTAQKLKFW